MTRQVRWGILGTASIATRKVIPGIHASRLGTATAIASRNTAHAEAAARANGIARWFGSYQQLLDDREIDAVYIPLPNDLHVEWSVRALEAGKHVLCEKPVALNADRARGLMAAARARPGLSVAEAFMYRCHPRWEKVKALVSEGAIGALGTIHTAFSYDNRDPANIRNIASMGGGAWLDIGCYGVSVARWLFDAEPVAVYGSMLIDAAFGTDRLTSAVLQFENGTATVSCATQLAPHQAVTILGSHGRIDLALPFNPPNDQPTQIQLQRANASESIEIPPCDQFAIQIDRFNDAIVNGAPVPVSIDDAVANMVALDAMYVGRS